MVVMVSECFVFISLFLFLMVCGVGCFLGLCVGLNFLLMIGFLGFLYGLSLESFFIGLILK